MIETIDFSKLDYDILLPIIREVVMARCEKLNIPLHELFNGHFNTKWIVRWIQEVMPLDPDNKDYHYQVVMSGCREEFLKQLKRLNKVKFC